ncbi:MAG: HD domain-containing phosphohydrolase [Bacillota bacterium]
MHKDVSILIIDDEQSIVNAMSRLLSSFGYAVYSDTNPYNALNIISSKKIQIIISDQKMRGMNGVDLLIKVKESFPDVIRILMSGYSDIEVIINAINEGNIYYYITKPWVNENVINIVKNAERYIQERQTARDQLRYQWESRADSYNVEGGTIELIREKVDILAKAILKIIRAKDIELYNHSINVSNYCELICRRLNLDEARTFSVTQAGLLHDIGKLAIRDKIIYKPSCLDENEFNDVKSHPKIAFDVLYTFSYMQTIAKIIIQHHERLNGSGYPYGIEGDSISLESRILAVADAYDALTADRVYRKGVSSEEAQKILMSEIHEHFDENVVKALLEV